VLQECDNITHTGLKKASARVTERTNAIRPAETMVGSAIRNSEAAEEVDPDETKW
jgi:hypothetical protein